MRLFCLPSLIIQDHRTIHGTQLNIFNVLKRNSSQDRTQLINFAGLSQVGSYDNIIAVTKVNKYLSEYTQEASLLGKKVPDLESYIKT